MKKIWNGATRRGNTTVQIDKSKPTSKVFGASLCDICDRESDTVPFIVKDICTFIEKEHLDCEGIFRLSSSASLTARLREAFEQHVNDKQNSSVCSRGDLDGHAAANVLKQFFRQLPQPLIPDEILKLSRDAKCISDESFAHNVKSSMATWPIAHRCTLQYLLPFLQLVMRNVKNRMTVTGLAVVFGPNVFKILDGHEGLEIQGLANQTFERLLLSADIICDVIDDQGYLNMTSPTSMSMKPARVAPPVPKQARPLPSPPVPIRATDDIINHTVTSTPAVPQRSISLERRLAPPTPKQDRPVTPPPDPISLERRLAPTTPKQDRPVTPPPDPTSLERRLAPTTPKQDRPVTPPPDPIYVSDDLIIKTVSSLPAPLQRSNSPDRDLPGTGIHRIGIDDRSSYNFSSEEDASETTEAIPASNNFIVEETIRDVVRKHLFTAESLDATSGMEDMVSANDCCVVGEDDASVTSLLPSLTAGRISGPKNRRKPTRKRKRIDDEFLVHEVVVESNDEVISPVPLPRKKIQTVSSVTCPTPPPPSVLDLEKVESTMAKGEPHSSLVTMEDTEGLRTDSRCAPKKETVEKEPEDEENTELISVSKFNLYENPKNVCSDVNEVVPPLDLSEVTEFDVFTQQKPLPRIEKVTPAKLKRRRKKGKSTRSASSSKPRSEPIEIPLSSTVGGPGGDHSSAEQSTQDGSSKWRDAWSTDDETAPVLAAMEDVMRHDVKSLQEDNIEVAPSSPENHFPRLHSHHHHKHHHHDNHLSRPTTNNNSLKEVAENELNELFASLRLITDALDINRKENGRPEDLTLMTREQIRNEKVAMQRELLKHESRHGRPSNKQEKEIMRNIYERYRMVKRLLADTMSPPFNSAHNRRFDDVEQGFDVNIAQQHDEFVVTQLLTLAPPNKNNHHESHFRFGPSDHVSADLDIFELRKQEREAKGQRKRLRRKLRDFEREIEQQHGRSINQADRVVMATEYAEYRDLKAKLRLLDALIEKHNSQQRSP